ncbi:MAG: cell division protein FtsQ/DivIB [Coprococcus sp.]
MENNNRRNVNKNRMSRNVDVAQTRRESGYVDVMTGKRLDGRVKVPVDKRRQQTDSRNGQRRADGDMRRRTDEQTRRRPDGEHRRTGEQARRRPDGEHRRTGEQARRRPDGEHRRTGEQARRRPDAERRRSDERVRRRPDGERRRSDEQVRRRPDGEHRRSDEQVRRRQDGERRRSDEQVRRRQDGERRRPDDRMRREDAEKRRSEERRRRKQDQAVAAKRRTRKTQKEGRKLTPEEIERKKKLQAEKLARRKARREKAARIFKIVLKILLILVVLCAIAFVYIRTCYKLKSIKVTGTDHYTDQQMVDIVTGGKDYGNTLLFILESRLNPAQDVTFIDKIDVTYVNRNSVEITVYEKAMAGCIKYNDQYAYFDGDGIVLEISDAKLDDVPCIEGLTSDSVKQGKKLDVGDSGFFQEILTMTQLIYKSGIQIDKITYDTDQNLILHKDGIKIRIGDGENLETKFMNLESILESVKGKNGTLDMSNYSESQRNVIFKENK